MPNKIDSENRKYTYLIIIFLIVACCAAFGRIVGNDFVNYDDMKYITENHHIQSGINAKNIAWAFTTSYMGNWHPLTWISHMLDWNLFGANASGHHLVSLFLHIGAVIFLFLFLSKTTKNIWSAAFAAAFFAIHPLRVESVAWASERKDVLSMFFGMLCLYSYAFYAESAKLSKYLLCLILFAFALMSKPIMITMPFLLMLIDYWPLDRWKKAMIKSDNGFDAAARLILEKIPFILLTVFSITETFLGQSLNKAVVESIEINLRITNAIVSYVAYLGKIFWPVNLAAFYPYNFSLPTINCIISSIIIIAITSVAIYYARKLPYLFVGWFWYLGTFIPVIGLVQVGMQSMADRYTYLPSIGIAIILSWVFPSLIERQKNRKTFFLLAGIIFLVFMLVTTYRQCYYWKDSIELWNHALKVTNESYLPYYNLGCALQQNGRNDEAIENFKKALKFRPNNFSIHNNLGISLLYSGDINSAAEEFHKTISLNPNHAGAHNNLAMIFYTQKRFELAHDYFQKAISLQPNYANAHYHLALIFAREKLYDKAFYHYNTAIKINPVYGTINYQSVFSQLIK